ncbi:MAG: hypothetical protein Q9219_003344 [cf. Caloplaca sp. 3 TL-2023]
MNSNSLEGTGRNLNGFYAYKDTFDRDSVWLEVPKKVTFVNVSDPYAQSSDLELDEAPISNLSPILEPADGKDAIATAVAEVQGQTLEALSNAASYTPLVNSCLPSYSDDHSRNDPMSSVYGRVDTRIQSHPPTASDPVSAGRSLDIVSNPPSTLSAPSNPGVNDSSNDELLPDSFRGFSRARGSHLKASTETDPKVAFLLRHFAETTGRWMDLYDQTTFFSSYIPVKSISNPLLKNAACAYAAKQIGRVNGRIISAGGSSPHKARMQTWEGPDKEDWALLAAEYYDRAISLLMEALQWDHTSSGENSTEEIDKRHYAPRTVEGMVEERRLRRRQFGSAQSTARSDDLLAATSILCEYESLDASNAAWAHHLSGTKSLLDVVEVGMMPLDSSSPEAPLPRKKLSQARKATFWNFARQDLFAAFVHECRTRLDTEDVALWKDAGLQLDENNLVVLHGSATTESGTCEEITMREDMIGNALIWLVSKLVRTPFPPVRDPIPSDKEQPKERRETDIFCPFFSIQMNLLCSPPSSSPSLPQKYSRLAFELETWFNALPETFMPSAIIPHDGPASSSLTEVWSSIPVCTATIMTWHMAQILMLVHAPPSFSSLDSNKNSTTTTSSSSSSKIARHLATSREILFHSRQIVGLCLARPETGVLIHALQPLYVAGQCLTGREEREVVLGLLGAVERETGWATGYRVRGLRGEWGWDEG